MSAQTDASQTSYYITTPIYYLNAAPHLGTAYTTLLCDIQARFRRKQGRDVLFLTGLDEHGEKVAQAAAAHGMAPQAWCDSLVAPFTELWDRLEISNDDFIRTTQERHIKTVQALWEKLKERGYIYKGSYDGWYCIPEETYFTETQVRHAQEAKGWKKDEYLCPDCERPLERVQEESWFFKLSAFEQQLLDYYEQHTSFIEPEIRRNEVVSFVKGGLKDLSISRTSFDWGVPLPFDTKHVTYVWFDALINYLTAASYGTDSFRRWPAQVHMVGKDIIRFHCVIWPAMLMAAGLDLPEQVFVHGFLLVKNEETGQGEKMSKSRGNAIAPADVIELLGVEGYRYYFASDVVPGNDGAISFSRMEQVYNTDLANTWGNLVSRSISMSMKYFDGKSPSLSPHVEAKETELKDLFEKILEPYQVAMENFSYPEALSELMKLIHAANAYIETSEPWTLAKDEARRGELAAVIYKLLETIRLCAHLLMPIMPETSREVLRRLSCSSELEAKFSEVLAWGALPENAELRKGDPLFPRLDTNRA